MLHTKPHVLALRRLAKRAGLGFGLLRETERVNRQRIDIFLDKIRQAVWVIKGKRIALLGLAFKPNTDDIRFSPAIELIHRLQAQGAQVRSYDLTAMGQIQSAYPGMLCGSSAYDVAQDADALLITTEWEEFRRLDWKRIHDLMARPLVLDGRNLLIPSEMMALGFEYHSIGRPR